MRLSPKCQRKFSDLLRMPRTVVNTPRSWMHLTHTGHLTIVNQKTGEESTGMVSLTRSEFERLIKFYEKAQVLVSRRQP